MLQEITLGERLKDLRLKHGYKNTESLAEKTGISKSTLNNYENNEKNQNASWSTLLILAQLYDVSMDYLLGLSEIPRFEDVSNIGTGLSMDAIQILQDEKINMRLVNEIVTHEAFIPLLCRMEIYIDSIASIQITSSNNVAETLEHELLHKYGVSADNPYMRSLAVAKVDEAKFMQAYVSEMLAVILESLREEHLKNKKDATAVFEDLNIAGLVPGLLQGWEISGGKLNLAGLFNVDLNAEEA